MIYQTLYSHYDLEQAFREKDRLSSFTRYDLLFDYLDNDDNFDGGYKLDVIEICGMFNEFESLNDFNKQYGTDYKSIEAIEQDHLVLHDNQEKFIVEAF
jgi:hypothetical protein